MAEHTPVFLNRPDAAARQLDSLTAAREIAVDTEGASFHRFVDRVYLLQMSTREQTAIVDPLAVPVSALSALGAALESQRGAR